MYHVYRIWLRQLLFTRTQCESICASSDQLMRTHEILALQAHAPSLLRRCQGVDLLVVVVHAHQMQPLAALPPGQLDRVRRELGRMERGPQAQDRGMDPSQVHYMHRTHSCHGAHLRMRPMQMNRGVKPGINLIHFGPAEMTISTQVPTVALLFLIIWLCNVMQRILLYVDRSRFSCRTASHWPASPHIPSPPGTPGTPHGNSWSSSNSDLAFAMQTTVSQFKRELPDVQLEILQVSFSLQCCMNIFVGKDGMGWVLLSFDFSGGPGTRQRQLGAGTSCG